ncbi:hypothetical protein K466DRAFT_582674 [Polyporus arcularius HHB13444]|uniref:Uncharacterized protein n=1 Tax=Polyporus arcularius HHB13444 TaxID=1314778 RepID=A0A5C3PR32_9APHY|nr:hypothetical protein K466DRAFT_582674 [Polyporus arcularius HHB13444]
MHRTLPYTPRARAPTPGEGDPEFDSETTRSVLGQHRQFSSTAKPWPGECQDRQRRPRTQAGGLDVRGVHHLTHY